MAKKPAKQDKKRNPDGTFPKGVSGNPNGRTPGSISIIGRIKQIWEEHPERFEEYVDGVMRDKILRRELIQQIDGKPRESVDITSKGEKLSVGIISFDDYDSSQPQAEQDQG